MNLIVVNESKLRRVPVASKQPLIESGVSEQRQWAGGGCARPERLPGHGATLRTSRARRRAWPPPHASPHAHPDPPTLPPGTAAVPQLVLRYQDVDKAAAIARDIEGTPQHRLDPAIGTANGAWAGRGLLSASADASLHAAMRARAAAHHIAASDTPLVSSPPNQPPHAPCRAEHIKAHELTDDTVSPRCVLAEFTEAGPRLAFRVGGAQRLGWGARRACAAAPSGRRPWHACAGGSTVASPAHAAPAPAPPADAAAPAVCGEERVRAGGAAGGGGAHRAVRAPPLLCIGGCHPARGSACSRVRAPALVALPSPASPVLTHPLPDLLQPQVTRRLPGNQRRLRRSAAALAAAAAGRHVAACCGCVLSHGTLNGVLNDTEHCCFILWRVL